MKKTKKPLSAVALLSIGFMTILLLGTALLMLPCASNGKTTLIDALFTATSASCVTGLIPFSTAQHWTLFGQIVILCLIQLGGLGFMTVITLVFMLFRRNIGLYNRTVLMQSAGSYNISGVTRLIRRILIGTAAAETLGAVLLSAGFWPEYGPKAIYYGIFHSISAFCNAGFDIFKSEGGSLTAYYSNPYVLTVIMALIVVGGLGFIVWTDVIDSKFRFRDFQLHTKIVLTANLFLILIPALYFFISEFCMKADVYENFSTADKIVNSFFLSVSPRTAGMNTLDLTQLSPGGRLMNGLLMFIGGNPGSTAGGVKVTTVFVILANLVATARGEKNAVIFKRKISNALVRQSNALLLAYQVLIFIACAAICLIEKHPLGDTAFEVISALGTVGLSVGISAEAGAATKLILAFLMYAGRLGALTLFDFLLKDKDNLSIERPEGKMLVG